MGDPKLEIIENLIDQIWRVKLNLFVDGRAYTFTWHVYYHTFQNEFTFSISVQTMIKTGYL